MGFYNSTGGNAGNGMNNMTVGDYANGVPNIRLSQIPASFAKQIPWMIPLILIGIVATWFLTKDIKRQYIADGSLLVQLGAEYVYDPTFGNANSGLTITPDYVALTEASIIKNQEILDQVTNDMIFDAEYGKDRFAPKLYDRYIHSEGQQQIDRWNDILKMVDKSYVVTPKPKSSIVNLVFKHEDGEVAVETLDRFMTAYQNFRKSKFVNETSAAISERRASTEEQLAMVEAQIQRILNKNDIAEFTAEKTGVERRAETLRAELNTTRSRISAAEAALAASEDQLRQVPEEIDLYVDDRASQRLAQAQLERRQLLSRYTPTSSRIKQKDFEIKELEAQIASNGGKASGGRRVGPNLVYQNLLTQRNQYQAQADSLREQEATIVAQLNSTVSKVRKMRKLSPDYQSLIREKSSLEEQLKNLNAKEQEAIVNQQQQENASDNIKEITRPTKARKGRNMRKIMFVLGSGGVVFTVLMLALLRVFLDPNLYRTGPSPHGHSYPTSGGGTGYNNAYVPEAVSAQSYAPTAAPPQAPTPHYDPYEPQPAYPAQPAYAPAAYGGGAVGAAPTPVFESQPYDATGQAVGATGFENPAPNPAYNASTAQAYSAEAVSQPSTQPYQAVSTGTGGDIPVLGSTQTNPYAS